MIECRYRFKEIGWTARRAEYDAVICEARSLMAFSFRNPDVDIRYMIGSIKQDEQLEEYKEYKGKDTSGLKIREEHYIGDGIVFRFEDKTGYYISIKYGKNKETDKETENESSEDLSEKIFYRVFLNKTGWTDYACDGEVCGELSDEENYITGIQVFSVPVNQIVSEDSLPEEILAKAESRVKVFEDRLKHSFLYCDSRFRNAEKASVNCKIERELKVDKIDNGIILPLRTLDTDSRDGIFAGGVCDSEGHFVAGLKRKNDKQTNMSVLESYDISGENIEESDEDVIYGGVIFPGNRRFGHMMIESMSRLWYLVESLDSDQNNKQIAFVILPESDDIIEDFFKLLGIDMDRITIVRKPTRFRSITIPEQSFILFSNYHEKCNLIYDKMMSSVEAKAEKKIYLTRRSFTRYDGANDGINEEYLEEFFKKRGFTVISPEQHPLKDQIAYMKGADEVVCSEGTLSHLGLFMRRGTKMTILRRSINSYLIPQYMIDEMRGIETYYVDANFNILPDSHVDSVFLFGPSRCFVDYLKASGITYTDDEVQMDRSLIYDYIVKYTENFRDTDRFESIKKYDIFDLIQTLNKVLDGEFLSRFNYTTTSEELSSENRALKKKIESLEKKLEKSEAERKEILNSKSWKITKPLRKLMGK